MASIPTIWRDRLGRRLLVGIVLTSSLLTLFITAYQVHRDYRNDVERIQSGMRLIEASYLTTLVNSLWSFDDVQTHVVLSGMASLPDVEVLSVQTPDGSIVQLGARTSRRVVRETFRLERETPSGTTYLGDLDVVASIDRVIDRLLERVIIVLAGNALKTFLVAGVALVLFHFLVTRHLRDVALHASRLSVEDPAAQRLRLSRSASGDAESDSLGVLERSVNDLALRLSEYGASLRQSEQRFRDLVDGSLQGVMVRDGGRILYANPAAARILGYDDPARLCDAKEIAEAFPVPAGQAPVNAAGNPGTALPERFEAEWTKRDGSPTIVENVDRIVSWFGTPAVQSTFVDVTARRQAEDGLRRHQERLEELVAARTTELERAHEELVRSERLSTIGQMTATVSHELRNPLGTIKASIDALHREISAPEGRTARALERIDRSIRRCTAIIQELIDFVQIRELVTTSVDLDTWVRETLVDVPLPDGVSLVVDAASGIRVRLDSLRMEQCVVNVVNNACQSMADQDAAMRIAVRTCTAAGRVEIAISDTGPGVPPALRERIFEPLFSTRGFGAGLGLSLVRQIMEQHRGGVEVEEAEHGGARVVLWLPPRAREGGVST